LHYPTDSIAVINPLQHLHGVVAVDITFTQAQHGVVTLLPNNTFQYVANSMEVVPYPDGFNFTVFDGINSHERCINIEPQFDKPIPNVPPLSSTRINDVCRDWIYPNFCSFDITVPDANNNPLNYRLLQSPLHGIATIESMDFFVTKLNYQPEAGFTGVDSIVYRACESNTTEQYCADVLRIIRVNDCDTSTLVAYDIDINTFSSSTAASTHHFIIYADNLPITIHIVSQGAFGNVVINPDNTFTYRFNNSGITTIDLFTYLVCDARGNCSDTATVSIMNMVHPNYFINNLFPSIIIPANESVALDFLSNLISDKSGVCIDSINSLLHYGTININPNGKYSYTPFAGLVAPKENWGFIEDIPYSICPTSSEWNCSKIRISIIFPACNNDTVSVTQQKPISLPVLDNDLSSEPLTITSMVMYPQYGDVKIIDNQLVYTAHKPSNTYDTLCYLACDSHNNCDTAMVFISIAADSTTTKLSATSNTPSAIHLKAYFSPVRQVVKVVVNIDQRIQSIKIKNMAGNILFSSIPPTSVKNYAEVPTGLLSKGEYLVEVQTDVGIVVKEMLIR
jgi:hypothetical protein